MKDVGANLVAEKAVNVLIEELEHRAKKVTKKAIKYVKEDKRKRITGTDIIVAVRSWFFFNLFKYFFFYLFSWIKKSVIILFFLFNFIDDIIFYPNDRSWDGDFYFEYKLEHLNNLIDRGIVFYFDDNVKLVKYVGKKMNMDFIFKIYHYSCGTLKWVIHQFYLYFFEEVFLKSIYLNM